MTPSTPRRPIVLVPGAWHGASSWCRVVPLLAERGYDPHPVCLTGVGERAHLVSPSIGLAEHVQDVVAHLVAWDLRDAVLVGHSYAGVVVRQAADAVPNRVGTVVLLDGWAGQDGTSMLDLAPDWFADALEQSRVEQGFGWLYPAGSPELVGITEPGDVAWLAERLTPHPARTFAEPTRLTGAVDAIPHVAVTTDAAAVMPFERWADDVGVKERLTMAGGHDAMLIDPAGLVERLVALAPPG